MAIVFSGDLLKNSKTFIESCRLWLTAIFAIKNTILVVQVQIVEWLNAKFVKLIDFMQKCTDEQLKYVTEFFRDYFSVPEYSSIFLVI